MSSKNLFIALIAFIPSITLGMQKNAGDLSVKEQDKLKKLIDKKNPHNTILNFFNYCDRQEEVLERIQLVKQYINSKDFAIQVANQVQNMVFTKQLIDEESLEKTISNINNFCNHSQQYGIRIALTKDFMGTDEFKTAFLELLSNAKECNKITAFQNMGDYSPWLGFVNQDEIRKNLEAKGIVVSNSLYCGPHACFGEKEYEGSSPSSSQSSSSGSSPSSSYGDYTDYP